MFAFFISFKILGVEKKYIAEKDYFEILSWPYVTFDDLWGHTVFDKFHDICIHINFYQNRFINESARNQKAKILCFLWDIEELIFLILDNNLICSGTQLLRCILNYSDFNNSHHSNISLHNMGMLQGNHLSSRNTNLNEKKTFI